MNPVPMPATRPLCPAFGVEVQGIDLAEVTPARHFPEIRDLFERHSALLFRGQNLSAEDHIRLARLFGPLEDRNPEAKAPGDAYKVPEVSNVLEDGRVSAEMDLHTLNLKANQLWHTDSTFLPVPALANLLVARVVTETGGETELASTRAAWEAMPESLQRRLRHARIRHRFSHSRARISAELAQLPQFTKWPDTVWPAVLRNPVTGAASVYIASHAVAVEGMGEAEGQALIEETIAFCTRPEFCWRHRWQPGDVLIWDERATLHRGHPWDYTKPRVLSSICVSLTDADGLAEMRA